VSLPGTLPEAYGYEHFQYTPYGESWVAEQLTTQINEMSHRFTGQELDQETGLYAFPARYYDPQTSRWLGADPAMGEYLPVAPTSEQARENNKNLGGEGGVFNVANLVVYHYTFNNPLKYIDPDGRQGHLNRPSQEEIQENWSRVRSFFANLGFRGPKTSTEIDTNPSDGDIGGEYSSSGTSAPGERTLLQDPTGRFGLKISWDTEVVATDVKGYVGVSDDVIGRNWNRYCRATRACSYGV
jgi:RHS repeat-associated protein